MSTVFERITGNDEIFSCKEYISDSLIFNTIESARNDSIHELYSDHKNVIILRAKNGPRVWLWTSAAIKDDTSKLIDICRFLRDCNIPKAEIYLKQEVAGNFSDLYALTTLEINYVVKDEFSIAVLTYNDKDPIKDNESGIVLIDKNNSEHVKLVKDFYTSLMDEFRWKDKLDRKVKEYLELEMYGYIKDNRLIANSVIGDRTEDYQTIKSIAVLTDERRKGYGYEMCALAVNSIKQRGLTPVLYSHVGNQAAMALWKKTHFKIQNKLYLLKIENND